MKIKPIYWILIILALVALVAWWYMKKRQPKSQAPVISIDESHGTQSQATGNAVKPADIQNIYIGSAGT